MAEDSEAQPTNIQVDGNNIVSVILQCFSRRSVDVMRGISPSLLQTLSHNLLGYLLQFFTIWF